MLFYDLDNNKKEKCMPSARRRLISNAVESYNEGMLETAAKTQISIGENKK